MAGSVVVALRQAIVAGLQAEESLSGVQIGYGWPGDDLAEKETVFLNRPRGLHDPASLKSGRTFRNEAGELDLVVRVEKVGGTAEEADDRALAIGALVEEFIADNTDSLVVTGLLWVRVASWSIANLYNDRGRLTELTYTLQWRARLT